MYDELEEQFRRRYRRRDRLTYHMIAWFIVNGALWFHWMVTRPEFARNDGLVTFSGLWMAIVIGHILNYVGSEISARRKLRVFQWRVQQIANNVFSRGEAPPPKPKRDWMDSRTRLILTEDGEYIDGEAPARRDLTKER